MNALPTPDTALRLPIHAETHAGFGEAGGLLSFDGSELVVEFQTRDSLFGLLKGQPQAVRVPLSAITEVRSGRGWFWAMPWFEVALSDFRLLTSLPGADGGCWRARVRFKDRVALARFAAALNFARAQALHERLTAGLAVQAIATPAQLELPPAPPGTSPPPRQRASE